MPTRKPNTKAAPRKTPAEAAAPVRATKKSATPTKPTAPEGKAIGGNPATHAAVEAKHLPSARVGKSAGRTTAKTATPKPATREPAEISKTGPARSTRTTAAEKKRAAPARKTSKPSATGASRRASKRASKGASKRDEARKAPAYLAAELGQPVDHEGEPIGAGSARVRDDAELQEYALQLWRQMQSGGVVKRYLRAIERAGLTVDEVWTVGLGEVRSTSSTPDEMRRYKQRLLFRANLLEALLTETIADLHRLEGVEPTPAPSSTAPPPTNASA